MSHSHPDKQIEILSREALMQELARYKRAGLAANQGAWEWDLSRDVVWWGEGVTNIFGFQTFSGETPASLWFESIHPLDRARVLDGLREAAQLGGARWIGEYRFKDANEKWVSVFHRASFSDFRDGRAHRVSGTIAKLAVGREAELKARALNFELDTLVQSRTRELVSSLTRLEEAEAHARAILAAIPDLLFEFERDGRILSYHTADSAELIVAPGSFVGKSVYDFLPESTSRTLRQKTKVLFETGEAQVFEYTMQVGSVLKHYEARVRLSGTQTALAICRDVTETRLAQREIEFQKNLLESQGEAAIDGILVVSAEGKILSYNTQFAKLWDLDSDVLQTKSDQAALDAVLSKLKEPEEFLEKVAYLYAHPEKTDQTEVHLCTGSIYDRYSAPIRGSDGRTVHGRVWFFRDVTLQRRNERLIAEQRNQLQLGMDIAQMTTWEWDCKNEQIHWSAAGKRLHGISSSEPISNMREFLNYVQESDRVSVEEKMRLILQGQNRVDCEYRVVGIDGKMRWFNSIAVSFKDESGHVSRVVGITRNITNEVEAQRLIQEQGLKMVSSSRLSALGEMAAGIAHEINNPLAIIHARAALLRDFAKSKELDASSVTVTAEKIESTVMRISRIVKSLKQFARDGSGDPFEVVPLARIIDETLDLCKERFKHSQVGITIEAVNPAAIIRCRPGQISQVLVNLLNNAFDAAVLQPTKWIQLSVVEEEDQISVLVSDSGSGIPVEIENKIMQPFFTTKGVGQGTGLGLSVSKGIVDSHGGTLRLDRSRPNTTFLVTLPKVPTAIQIKAG